VYPSLTAQQAAAMPAYDLLILHRVPAQAIEPLRAATGLSARSAKWLPRMPDDVVALVAGGHARYGAHPRPCGAGRPHLTAPILALWPAPSCAARPQRPRSTFGEYTD